MTPGGANRVQSVVSGKIEMLSKRHCPHTGVVNFFLAADPHLAVGSVVKGAQSGYLWHCYTDPCQAAGSVADMKTAERRVRELCRRAASSDHNPTLLMPLSAH
jgi:hypothetical protein